jgi:hypothetical protein
LTGLNDLPDATLYPNMTESSDLLKGAIRQVLYPRKLSLCFGLGPDSAERGKGMTSAMLENGDHGELRFLNLHQKVTEIFTIPFIGSAIKAVL